MKSRILLICVFLAVLVIASAAAKCQDKSSQCSRIISEKGRTAFCKRRWGKRNCRLSCNKCKDRNTTTTTTTATPTTTTTTPTTTTTTPTTTTTTTTTTTKRPIPTSCAKTPYSKSREVVELANGITVMCDTETDGGGWAIFQRRIRGNVNFNVGWHTYAAGFGHITDDYWLGLDDIHTLCPYAGSCEMRVDLTYKGVNYYAKYRQFSVASKSYKYQLRISGYSGTAGDAFENVSSYTRTSTGMPFSTPDFDNDNWAENSCAKYYSSGGWFNGCFDANLNGLWGTNGEYSQGLIWYPLTDWYSTVGFTEMKIRRY